VVELLVVVGPDVVADRDLLSSLAMATGAELGVTARVVSAATGAELAGLVAAAGPVVAVPGDRTLITPGPDVVWYDLTVEDPVPDAVHLHGRGVWGLAWAVRHAVHRHRHPARRVTYGDHPDQWADVRTPDRPDRGVAVLLHGGFWRSVWAADLMDALAIDLTARGFESWNVEYRRPDRHGWDATVADVAAALDALGGRPAVVFGHSAGGQLALRAAADAPHRVALVVSLAGVVDLAEGQRRGIGEGAIPAALGGTPDEVAPVYAASDPMARLPAGVPALLVQGAGDSPDLVDMNRRYAARAGAAGDDVSLLELPGDHFDVIAPGTPIWGATMDEVEATISRS
jgi:acetyl esterase/lipase